MLSVILSVLSGGTGIKTLVPSKKPPLIFKSGDRDQAEQVQTSALSSFHMVRLP
jgi:hypothetical protein